jgi:hypothetical protein
MAAFAIGCGRGDGSTPTGPELSSAGTRTITISPNSTPDNPLSIGSVTAPFSSTNSVSKTFTVSNSGTKVTSNLTVSPLSAPFAITADNCTGHSLGTSSKNNSCTFTVTFTPTAAGTPTAALTVTVAQPKTTFTVNLSGTAQVLVHSLSGTVFNDANIDGVQGSGEGGVNGVTVQLTIGATVTPATTANTGAFTFPSVPDGASYVVSVVPPAGEGVTAPARNSSGDRVYSGTLSADVTGLDFGVASYTITGTVLVTPSSTVGVPVTLSLNANATTTLVETTTTDAIDGTYGFAAPALAAGQSYTVAATVDGTTKTATVSSLPAVVNFTFP